jgi:hypothetical protein
VQNDRRVSICEVDEEVKTFYGSCHANWREHLWIRCVSTKREERKENCLWCWICLNVLTWIKILKIYQNRWWKVGVRL